jgi:hypothetical protein
MAPLASAWLALRITALLTGMAGLIAMTAPMPAPLRVGALLLAAGGAYVSAHHSVPHLAGLSKIASPVLLTLAVGSAALAGVGPGGSPIIALAYFATGVYLAHGFAQRTVRDVLGGATLSLFMSALPLAAADFPRRPVLLVLCWLGAATAVAIAHHIAHQETATVVAVQQSGATDRVRPARGMAGAVALAMLFGLLTFLILPRPDGAAARRGLSQRGAARFGSNPEAGPARRDPMAYSGGDLDLRARGRLPETPVLDVPSGSPGLWRGATLDSYTGSTWTKRDPPLVAAPVAAGYQVSADPTSVGLPARATRVDEVHAYGPWLLLVAPGQPERVQTGAQIENGPAGPMLFGADTQSGSDIGYVVHSTSTAADRDAATATGADLGDPRWTALPALPARVHALAQSIASPTGDRMQTVRAVERDLRARATYRLDPPVPSANQDAVDHFLFDGRTGFCEHFASAEVVLLRSLGIPARLVTGFAGGEQIAGDRRMMRASNAHAWVEVWFPGVGWVSSDPTAGTTRADDARGWLARLMSAITKALASGRGRLLIATGIVAVCLAAWGVWWLRRRQRRRRTPHQALLGRGPLWVALARLEVALATTGQPSPPAETLSELGQRLSCRPDETRALGVLERLCYSGTPPTSQEERRAAAAIDGLATRLLAAAAAASARAVAAR